MKNGLNIAFFVSILATGVILNSFPLPDIKQALHKLGPAVQNDLRFREQVGESCDRLSAKSASQVETFILEHLPIPSRTEPGTQCELVAKASKVTRYHIRSFWNFQVQVRNANGAPVADRGFAVDFPRPLVLLPLMIFLLALVFEFKGWGLGWTVSSYVILLCGGNMIQGVQALGQGLGGAFVGDQSWTGLFLILFWAALCRGQRVPRARTAKPKSLERWLNRATLGAIGLWNPAAFTLAGRLIFPYEGAISRLGTFFTLQAMVFGLSLYLLALDFQNLKAFFGSSLLLPRYLLFAVVFFLLFSLKNSPRRERAAWKVPGFWRTVLLAAGLELSAAFFPVLDGVSTLTRVGIALVLGQLLWPFRLAWKEIAKNTLRWGSALLLAASLALLGTQQSANELALLVFDPRIHPTGIVLFTFVSGLGLGFITGNFAAAFFTLLAALPKFSDVPLIKAALLDGVLAGMLLSPFSLLNLIPAAQFRLKMNELIAMRFRQLYLPLIIGSVIYAIGSVNSVAILRPATFVFLCLVVVVVQLKKGAWRIPNYTISPDSRNVSH